MDANVVTPLPDRVVVVGDLHLGEGVEPVGGLASGEHFFRDQELATWLGRLAHRAATRARRLELVLNGDAFDFLRVVRVPDTPDAVAEWRRLLVAARVPRPRKTLRRAAEGRFTFRERLFGLGTDEASGVWKLSAIAAAHGPVFRALASFCRAGHALVVIRGNHDQEWAWPGVRRAFLALLARAGAGSLRAGQVSFRSRAHRRANVYIEHGHGMDWLTRTERDFVGREPARLWLPFGSLITRYVLNVLERRVSAPVTIPPSRRLVEAVRQRPWRMLPLIVTNAVRAIPFIGLSGWKPWLRRLLQWWPARVGITMSTALLVVPPLAPLFGATGLPLHGGAGCTAASCLGFGLAVGGFMSRQIAAQIDGRALLAAGRRYARRAAAELKCGARRRYVVLGHTHRAELEACEDTQASAVYLNPGAWDVRPCFVWLARRGTQYARHRLMPVDAVRR